jgi:hypothetical protein
MSASVRVDIQAASTHITGVNAQFFGLAALNDVAKYFLHTLLVKVLMLSERDNIFQQPCPVDWRTTILNIH